MVAVAKKADNDEVELVYKNINDIVIPPSGGSMLPKKLLLFHLNMSNYSLYVLP